MTIETAGRRFTTLYTAVLGLLLSSGFAAGASAAEITLYEHADYRGAARSFDGEVPNMRAIGWNDKASSFRIQSGTWELCRDIDFRDCRTFRSDERDLSQLKGWIDSISSLRRVGGRRSEIEVYEHSDYEGSSRSFDQAVSSLKSLGWNDRISSIRVLGGRWQVCRHDGFRDCREIGADQPFLDEGWNDEISSLRPLRPFRNR